MKRINRRDKTIIEFNGWHPRAAISLVFAGFMAFPILIVSSLLHKYQAENGVLITVGMVLFLLVLLTFSCLRTHICCDLDRNQLTVETRMAFIPVKSQAYTEGNVTRVLVERQLHRNKNTTYYTYPVSLVTSKETTRLSNLRDQLLPRALAEACAKAVKAQMADQSAGAEVTREWDELDMSIREHASKHGETPSVMDLPEPVGHFKGNARLSGTDLEVTIPEPMWMKFRKFIPFIALFPLIPIGVTLFVIGSRDQGPPLFIIAPFVVFAVIVAVVVTISLRRLGGGVTGLKATPETLTLQLGSKQVTLKADDIEELNLSHPQNSRAVLGMYGGSITVRTDEAAHAFGSNLSGEELEWLHKTLFAILAG
jgi:hypothetical protein